MAEELQTVWQDINHPPKDNGCVRCGRTVNDPVMGDDLRSKVSPWKVEWRCAGCNRLVCRHCTFCVAGWRAPTEPHGPSGWDNLPSPGGREYLSDTICSDVADEGGVTLEEVGELMGVTRERIRQVEAKALRRIMKTDSLYRRHLRERLRELK